MTTSQAKARERIKTATPKARSMCKKALKENRGEADTREIVRHVLTEMLGWKMLDEVTQEEMVIVVFCDFAINCQDVNKTKRYMVFEVKKIGLKLNESHLKQARHYAQDMGVDWIALTNGDEWQMYKLCYKKKSGQNPQPYVLHLFTTSITDTTIKPAERIEMLYLMSKEAMRNKELGEFATCLQVLAPQQLSKRLFQKDVIDRLRIGIKNDHGIKISNEELAHRLVGLLDEDAKPSNLNYYLQKLAQ